jgi:hypothetical protein
MLDDYNKRNAEKTAEIIADDPKEGASEGEGGFISNFYDTVKEVVVDAGEGISSAVEMAGDAWDQGFEWNPGKKDPSDNMKRILAEHKKGGGRGYADQTFPPPRQPIAQARPGEFPQSQDEARTDFSTRMSEHRKRLAAQKNGMTNKNANDLREKRGNPFNVKQLPFADHVKKVQEVGNVDALGEKIRPLGSGKAEDEALYDAKKTLQEYGDIFTQDPESYDVGGAYGVVGGEGWEGERGGGDRIPPEERTAMPPPPKKVVPETVVPATKTVVPEQEVIKSVEGGTPDRYSSYPHAREFEKMDYEEGGPEAGGGQGGSRTADENAVHQDSKKLNAKILNPDTSDEERDEAIEFRKKVYAHLPPRERALAKEETGNYWIDPISGVAINVDAIEADGKRKSNWLMIDKLPEHARPWFMAKFGYLDEEDVDGMPMDPKLKIAEMNVQAKKLELESLEKRHTESTGVQYAQITGKSALQAANLRWEKEKYNNLSKAQQEELQIKQYNQVRSNVDMLFKNGQYESAMLLGQGLGIPYVMDMKGYWRSKAKTTDIDPMFGMALRGSGLEGLSKKAAGTAYYKAIGDYWKDLITPSTDPEMKSSYFQETAKKNGHRLWNDLSDAERKIAGNPMLHHNSIRSKLLTELMGKDPRFGTLHTSLNDLRTQRNLGSRGDGADKPEVVPKKKKKKTISKKYEKTSSKFVGKPDLAPKNLVEKIMAENTDKDGTPKKSLWEHMWSGPKPKWAENPEAFQKHTLEKYFKDGKTKFNRKMKKGGGPKGGSGTGKVFGNISEARKYYKTHTKELHKLSDELRYYIESGR